MVRKRTLLGDCGIDLVVYIRNGRWEARGDVEGLNCYPPFHCNLQGSL